MISINSDTVHAWVINTNQLFNAKFSANVLSNVHGRISAKKANSNKRSRYSFLREILSLYLDHMDLSEIMLSINSYGKPQLIKCEPTLHFNISHADGISLCVLSNCSEIGADIEKVKYFPYYMDAARTFLTSEEFKLISGLPQHEQLRTFYKLWSIKESCSKGVGLGLNLDFKMLNIVSQNNEKSYQIIDSRKDEFNIWHANRLQIHENYEAFVATKFCPVRIEMFSLNIDYPQCTRVDI